MGSLTHRLFIPGALLLLGVSACNAPGERVEPLEIYAAASLTDAFLALEVAFEQGHPDIDVVQTFAGSQVLRLQIESGAPADVFASANASHMDALASASLVDTPTVFAENSLVIITPTSRPSPVTSLETLPLAEQLVIGTEAVPVGRYTRVLLEQVDADRPGFAAQTLDRVVSEESNVRLIRAKVELGEADAAVVYRTDAVGVDGIRVVPLPEGRSPIARYPIARVRDAAHAEAADQWIAFVRSAEGQAILEAHGFHPAVP